MDEKTFLESVTATYGTDTTHDEAIRSLALRAFAPYIKADGNALEFGCDAGYMTQPISERVNSITVVDGSATFLELTRARNIANARFVHSLFEEYETSERYDHIFMCYVLEHVIDPVALLRKSLELLSPGGTAFIVVPNASAMSRQLARHMGLIEDLYALTENDHHHGHRRTYDRRLLDRDIEAAGLVQICSGGLMLKPFADFQMNALFAHGILGPSQIDGLYRMGLEYPTLAGSLFSACRARQDMPALRGK